MNQLFGKLRFLAPAAVAAVAVLAVGSGTPAFAYGSADNPVAQVEVSGNCTNASVCPGLIDGTGGVWVWAELDTGGTVDYTLAGCGHTVGGVGGPGAAGGGGGPGTDGTWHEVSLTQMLIDASAMTVLPVDVAVDKQGNLLDVDYYEIYLPGGGEPFAFAVPVHTGHYSVGGLQYINDLGRTPGVNFQTQVAP